MTSPLAPLPMSCAEVLAALPAYRAGSLAAHRAWPLEVHAAHCPACEALLEPAVPLPNALPMPDATAQSAMRREVLSRVRATRHTPAIWQRTAPWALLAAAAVVILMLMPTRQTTNRTRPDTVVTFDATASAPMVTARRLAESQAAPEFAALDAAEGELRASLAATPHDSELLRFHQTLEARRRELSQRVARVAE